MLLRIKMVLIQVVFALICNLQLVSTGLADVSVTVDVSSTTDVYPNFSTIDSAWNHILKLQFGSPYTSAVIRFLPGTYVIAHNLTRTFANMSIRHVADTPNTVTLVTPLMTSTADVPTLVEMGNGTNSYLEFTNLTVAIPDNGMFHLTMTGNNATMNVTNCLFEGAGYYSRLTLRVGHLDINRASQFISTNNILRNLAPDIAVYRIAGAHIKGGGAYQMFRYQGAPLKAESGPVLIEDYEARNYTWSQNPVFQYLNKYRATWKSYQLRMRNVTISGKLNAPFTQQLLNGHKKMLLF
ncbi:hypothetical protein DFS34DRAFT_628681 [Phlyctochytrium arcticum]|nr:hypothetical protein DFS34DRAFT_628681 [Phlyctochytrium arcticum]